EHEVPVSRRQFVPTRALQSPKERPCQHERRGGQPPAAELFGQHRPVSTLLPPKELSESAAPNEELQGDASYGDTAFLSSTAREYTSVDILDSRSGAVHQRRSSKYEFSVAFLDMHRFHMQRDRWSWSTERRCRSFVTLACVQGARTANCVSGCQNDGSLDRCVWLTSVPVELAT
ncbi:hypothetical protein HPB47_023379, partial [Ixodes persulcatus]